MSAIKIAGIAKVLLLAAGVVAMVRHVHARPAKKSTFEPENMKEFKKPESAELMATLSLDYVPDSQGHVGSHAAVEKQNHSDGAHEDHEATAAALKRVRNKVARAAGASNINYPILLDEHNEVGGRFNGGELPTTAIVDAQGDIRRRFVGVPSLPIFEGMLAEAQRVQ